MQEANVAEIKKEDEAFALGHKCFFLQATNYADIKKFTRFSQN